MLISLDCVLQICNCIEYVAGNAKVVVVLKCNNNGVMGGSSPMYLTLP